ncbi:chitinase 2-like [Gastrolobium bilobum]|nr:chitinase 2-like [Gastrolobium bilobum]
MSRNILAVVKPKIFREYIGVKEEPDSLNDFPDEIINSKIGEFHFILGFAMEDYDNNGRGTGIFKRRWNYGYFSPEKIKKLKNDHENEVIKVVISIGGRASGDTKYPFNPAEKEVWIEKAQESLKEIIKDYKGQIDGIDINYENIESDDFSHCIGKVINGLKNKDGVINVVSIAPSYPVQAHYKKLYMANGKDINWVDYQFYDQIVSTKVEFIKLYSDLSNVYDKEKLLAGFSTDPNDAGKISREVFLEGCNDLISSASLPGIFVWNANDSALNVISNDVPFYFEKLAQRKLTDSTS